MAQAVSKAASVAGEMRASAGGLEAGDDQRAALRGDLLAGREVEAADRESTTVSAKRRDDTLMPGSLMPVA
jgi:hypothetical protein